MSEQDALEQLQHLLQINSELLQAQNKANELKELELKLKGESLKAEQDKVELERQNKALQREALNRAETRLQEVLQRYVGLAERVEILIGYVEKNIFKDDAFKDILAALSERFETFELGMMLALMDKLESPQIKLKASEVVDDLGNTLNVTSKRRQLMSHQKNLNYLEEQAAQGDDSLRTINKIQRVKEEIERLERELGRSSN